MTDSRRIAKNTIFLYFRMIIIVAVSFYTSRVVLDKLGVDDYGLFNAVAGVVGMLTFLNNTLAKGTSRFLTFELGNGDENRQRRTFSTAFFSHLLLMFVMLLILETFGVWFLDNKLAVPVERLWAARRVYQLSLVSLCVSILQVPYTSSIIAHEDMSLYAYLSIGEAVAKLLIVYVLSISLFDKMIVYAALLAVVQLLTFCVYFLYCKRRYPEAKLGCVFDGETFKSMLSFSGWNIISHLSETLKIQGSNILINMFFRPSLVAAQAIANSVTNVAMNFVYQFTTALNPQIIKTYASGDYKASQELTLRSTVFVFDLVLLFCLPLFFAVEPLLNIWLVEVPEMAVDFLRIALVCQIIGTFNVTFYTPMLASGRLKTNSLWSLYLGVGQFAVIYILYKVGFGVLWLPWMLVVSTAVFSFYIKPIILYKELDYDIKEMGICFWRCFKVFLPAALLAFGIYCFLKPETLLMHSVVLICNVCVVLICSFVFMDKGQRSMVISLVKSRIRR